MIWKSKCDLFLLSDVLCFSLLDFWLKRKNPFRHFNIELVSEKELSLKIPGSSRTGVTFWLLCIREARSQNVVRFQWECGEHKIVWSHLSNGEKTFLYSWKLSRFRWGSVLTHHSSHQLFDCLDLYLKFCLLFLNFSLIISFGYS